MPGARLLADLSVFRQGLYVGFEFGARALAHLTSVGELIQQNVYETGSLRLAGDRVEFVLRNPPLRMGAFSSLGVAFDSIPVALDFVEVDPGTAGTWYRANGVTRETPITLPVGQRTCIRLKVSPTPNVGAHHVRLELRSLAIPPLVWLEFVDVLRHATALP
jgi:hypothetical protein